jgi:hypothetical protein
MSRTDRPFCAEHVGHLGELQALIGRGRTGVQGDDILVQCRVAAAVPQASPAVTGQDVARHAVQPQPRLVAGGQVLDTPPCDLERLGHHVGRVLSAVAAADRTAQDLFVGVEVDLLEPGVTVVIHW